MKMTSSAVWTLLALGAVWLGAPVCNAALGDSVGCDNDWIPFLNDKCPDKFTQACARFDACYHCGKLFNVEKDACDKGFLADLELLCKQEKNGRRHLQLYVSPVFRTPRYTLGKTIQHRSSNQCVQDARKFYDEVRKYVNDSGHLCYNKDPKKSECEKLKNCMP